MESGEDKQTAVLGHKFCDHMFHSNGYRPIQRNSLTKASMKRDIRLRP